MLWHRYWVACKLVSLGGRGPIIVAGVCGGLCHLPRAPGPSHPNLSSKIDTLTSHRYRQRRSYQSILSDLAAPTAFAGSALCSEYDVVNEIIEIERRLPFRLTWERVRGHQDDKKKWYELTWMETLNLRADAHVTDGLDIPGDPQTTITLIPSSKIGLRVDQTDITSKYATHF